jgi:hypothetical protein
LSEASLVLSYFKTLIWPAIVLVVIIVFRRPIGTLLGSIEEFEGFGVRAKIGHQLTQAAADAEQSLAQDQVKIAARRRTSNIDLREIASRMNMALELNWGVPWPADANLVERMRAAVEALDRTVNAILVVVGTSGWRPPGFEGSAPAAIPVTVIADQLVILTGYSGWNGAVNSRNILRRGLAAICGKTARRIRPADAAAVIDAVVHTRERLRTLIDSFASSLNSDV